MRNYILQIALAVLLSIGFSSAVLSQNVILEQDVNADTVIPDFGKNRRHFTSVFFDVGFPVGQTSGGDSIPTILMGASWNFRYGLSYKLRLSNFYSLLGQVSYQRSAYHFDTEKPVSSGKLVFNDVAAEFSNRFNFDRHGDYTGYYLELGISGAYTFMNKYKSTADADDKAVFKKIRTSLHGLDYVEPLAYAAHARLGFNRYVLFGEYRISDKLKPEVGYQLPPLSVGFRISFGS